MALIGVTPTPTAVFAANNILAEGLLVALGREGLRVPRDMSVVSFDDLEWMAMVDPPLTTVRQPTRDMARGAAELVLRRLQDGGNETPTTMVFRTDLIERGSVAPVRTRKRSKAAAR